VRSVQHKIGSTDLALARIKKLGLMVVLITVGVMNLPWMVGLAAVIFIEKIWRYGKAFSIAFGVALIIFACFVPWNPSLIPGLYMTGGM